MHLLVFSSNTRDQKLHHILRPGSPYHDVQVFYIPVCGNPHLFILWHLDSPGSNTHQPLPGHWAVTAQSRWEDRAQLQPQIKPIHIELTHWHFQLICQHAATLYWGLCHITAFQVFELVQNTLKLDCKSSPDILTKHASSHSSSADDTFID